MLRSTTGPVVASGQQDVLVKDRKLVMHVVTRTIEPHINSFSTEEVYIGSEVTRLIVVRQNADNESTFVSSDDLFANSIIRNGEDTDVS